MDSYHLNLPPLLDLISAAVNDIIVRAPNEVIHRHGRRFIERWYLARKGEVPIVGGPKVERMVRQGAPATMKMASELENLYVHRYVSSDIEEMHCHPWANASLIIRGRLVEATPDGTFTRTAGDIVVRDAHERHALIEAEPATLTLFGTARKSREWGFYPDGQFVPWQEYRTNYAREEAMA